MSKGLPEYSNEELMQMLEEFKALSEQDKASRRLGSGVDKIVYDIPDKNLVLKLPNTKREYTKYGLDSDYLYSKKMNNSIPVETPVLIKSPGSPDALIQRKLTPLSEQNKISDEVFDSIYEKFKNDPKARQEAIKQERARIKELPDEKRTMDYYKAFDKAGLNDADLHRGNLAVDKDGITKAIDVAPFYYDRIDKADELNRGLANVRETFFDKMDKVAKPRIYRSIAGLASGGLSLAAEASDAEEEGALLRAIDEQKFQDNMLKNIPEYNKEAVIKDFDENRLGLKRQALKDIIKRK